MMRHAIRHTVAAIVICALLGGFAVWIVWLVPRWHLLDTSEHVFAVGACVCFAVAGYGAHEWGRG